MTIEKYIKHCKEVAELNRNRWKNCPAEKDTRAHLTCEQCAEEHEQLAEWLTELKALRLLLDWAVECGFGLDNFPDEYEKYKHTLNDDMSYADKIKQIALCVIKEDAR